MQARIGLTAISIATLAPFAGLAGLCSAQASRTTVVSRDLPHQLQVTVLEGEQSGIKVYFNPKEITIDKSVPWQKHKNPDGDKPTLEFTSAQPESLTVELQFDMFETGNAPGNYPGNAPGNYPGNYPGNAPGNFPGNYPSNTPGTSPGNVVPPVIRPGDAAMAYFDKVTTVDAILHRPPMVMFQWGNSHFQGVLTRYDVKYTLFLPDGTPTRATVTVTAAEADKASFAPHDEVPAPCPTPNH